MTPKAPTQVDCMGHTVEEKLLALGVTGVLRQMAERGQIIELLCEMPLCYCPNGRTYFEKRTTSPFDWAPSMDHYPILKSRDGKRYAENARLAHVSCNARDYTVRKQISDLLKKGMSLEGIAESLNSKKVPAVLGGPRWSAAAVRRVFIS